MKREDRRIALDMPRAVTTKLSFADCRVGDRAVSPGRTITETDVLMFAALTGDWNPLHTDAEYARATMFGGRIAHGLMLLAIGGGMLFRGNETSPSLVLSGIDKVRFPGPARIGATVHLESEVTRLIEIDAARRLVTVNHRMTDESGREVLTYTLKLLVEGPASAVAGDGTDPP